MIEKSIPPQPLFHARRNSAKRGAGGGRLVVAGLLLALLLLAMAVAPPFTAAAQPGYPDRPIRIVVPFASGGTADIIARIAADQAGANTGWRVVIENITGAGGSIGAASAARAPADGYTLLLCNVSCAANQFLQGNAGFDSRDLAPIIVLGNVPNVLVVGPSVPVSTLFDFVALARAHPGKLALASAGPGSSSNLSAELLKFKAQLDILDVPYRGSSAAIPDILSGRVDGMVMGLPESLPLIREGKFRPLGVTTSKRAAALPDVPTFVEAGVAGYSFPGWLSLFAPRNTPVPLLAKLNAGFEASLQAPTLRSRFAEQNIEPGGGPPELAVQLLRSDVEIWGQVLANKHK